MSALFSPYKLRGVTLRNRTAVSPMCEYSSVDGFANDWHVVRTEASPAGPPLPDRFRNWSQATMERGLPAQDESLRLLWAMALGWTTALTDEVSEPFMRTGTIHIFSFH